MFDHVGKFKDRARAEVIKIVEELDKPLNINSNSRNVRQVIPLNRKVDKGDIAPAIQDIINHFCDA